MHFTSKCINTIVSFTILYYEDFKITIKSQIDVRTRLGEENHGNSDKC
jgi:hypothetical protein